MHELKKVLIISYHFPPDAAIGALRPSKFAKYMPACGWDPIILTVKECYYPKTDQSKTKDLKHIREIYRTGMLPHSSRIYPQLKAYFRRQDPGAVSPATFHAPSKKSKPVGFFKRLVFSLEHLPDDKQVWIAIAVWKGFRIIRTRNVHCILTSGPPMSCHVIGLLLRKMTGLKWVADFRDPWLSSTWKPPALRSRFSDSIEHWLEKSVVLNADKVVTASRRMQEDFTRRYPSIHAKTEVVLNGYDPADYADDTVSLAPRDPFIFTMTHTGTMYKNRTAVPFLRALSDLIKDGEIPKDRVRVNFIGESGTIRNVVTDLVLDDVVAVIDSVDYKTCIQYLRESDVLLLFAQNQPLQIPGKFYDYIAVRKPILIFTEEGATADLAKQVNRGIIIDSSGPALIAEQLRDLYKQFQQGELAEATHLNLAVELTKPELTQKLMAGIP